MKVLIIGGAGYIGSVVARKFVDVGHQVTILDNLSTGHREFVPNQAELIIGDACDQKNINKILEKAHYDGVIFLAALIKVGESMEHPDMYFANNLGSLNVTLSAMAKHGVKNFLFSSSGSVYGNKAVSPIKEESAMDPQSVYTETKVMAEKMIYWYSKIYQMNISIFRYFNAAGSDGISGMLPPLSHLIPIINEVACQKREKIQVFGTDYPTPDGTCIRDYIHVSDLADVHLIALEKMNLEAFGYQVFNLGRGQGTSVLEAIKSCQEVLGRPINYEIAPRRPNDADAVKQFSDCQKAAKILGWRAKKDLKEIILSDYQFRKNQK